MSNNPPGWYPDPFARAEVRWWSGSGWTDHVATGGREFLDPPGAGSHAVAPTGPAPAAVPAAVQATPPAAASRFPPAMQKLAMVAVAALLVGGLAGWMIRGDGGDAGGGGGGGAAAGSLTTPLVAGLTSLDSYEFRISITSVGPTEQDRSEMTANGSRDAQADLRYEKMVSTDTTADDPEPSVSTSESWQTADISCSFDGEEYTAETANPFTADFGTVVGSLFDVVVPRGNSTLVGTEQVAGVDAEHYTFTVQGLGADSGTQVDQNQGDVWVAVDGGYLLKYQVTASLRTTNDDGVVESRSMTVLLELTSVNQPVTITMPAQCAATGTVSG